MYETEQLVECSSRLKTSHYEISVMGRCATYFFKDLAHAHAFKLLYANQQNLTHSFNHTHAHAHMRVRIYESVDATLSKGEKSMSWRIRNRSSQKERTVRLQLPFQRSSLDCADDTLRTPNRTHRRDCLNEKACKIFSRNLEQSGLVCFDGGMDGQRRKRQRIVKGPTPWMHYV